MILIIIFLKLYLESKYLFIFISIIKKYWSLFEMNVWNFLVNICHFFSDFAKNGRWNQAANIWLCSYFITESIQRKVQLLEFEIRNLTDQSRTVCFHRKNEYLFKVLPMTMIIGIGNLLVRNFFLLKEGIWHLKIHLW